MTPVTRIVMAFLLAALPPVAGASGKYSLFADPPVGDPSLGTSTVGVNVYRSAPEVGSNPFAAHRVVLFGDYTRGPRAADDNGNGAGRRFVNFGVRWQHRMSATDSVSVLAEQGESSLLRPALPQGTDGFDARAAGSDMRATFAWTHELPLSWKPSVTGGVFLGDEVARDDSSRFIGRRYYGFSVGGELRLLQAHRPYVSFRMQRSLYDLPGEDNAATPGAVTTTRSAATGDSSHFAAGWRWHAARGLSLQAEASYGTNLNNTDTAAPLERERSRVFFGTRFDFR
jgi:hypothetical protein